MNSKSRQRKQNMPVYTHVYEHSTILYFPTDRITTYFFFLKQMLEVHPFILYSACRIHFNFYQMNRLSNSGVKDIKCTINKL